MISTTPSAGPWDPSSAHCLLWATCFNNSSLSVYWSSRTNQQCAEAQLEGLGLKGGRALRVRGSCGCRGSRFSRERHPAPAGSAPTRLATTLLLKWGYPTLTRAPAARLFRRQVDSYDLESLPDLPNCSHGNTFVELFRSCTPYIRMHQGKIVVIHVSSLLLERNHLFNELMQARAEVTQPSRLPLPHDSALPPVRLCQEIVPCAITPTLSPPVTSELTRLTRLALAALPSGHRGALSARRPHRASHRDC